MGDAVTGTKRTTENRGEVEFTHLQGDEEFEHVEDGPEWVQRDSKRGRWLTAVHVRQMGLFREEEVDKVEGLVDRWLSEVKGTDRYTGLRDGRGGMGRCQGRRVAVRPCEESTGRGGSVHGGQVGLMGTETDQGMLGPDR